MVALSSKNATKNLGLVICRFRYQAALDRSIWFFVHVRSQSTSKSKPSTGKSAELFIHGYVSYRSDITEIVTEL